jgi:exosortase C (VPDSG-CTERM-specific)
VVALPRAPRRGLFPRTRLGWFGWFAALLTAFFIEPLFSLTVGAVNSDLDSYIVLVPFVSAYLFYIRRRQLTNKYSASPWGIVPSVAGLAALTGAQTSYGSLSNHDYLVLMALAFVCLLAAGGFVFLGRRWMAAAAFPFAFLVFMVPMPEAMANTLETALKLASTEAANFFFNITGTPVLRDDTIFQLPNITIQVNQECSGIRSSLLAANLFLRSTWRRAVLICFVIPLGVVRNGFRVFVIGTLCIHFGPQMIHSIIHRRGGPIFFALSLIPLFALLWWLRKGDALKAEAQASESEVRVPPGVR